MKRPLLIWTYHRVLPGDGNAAVSLALFERHLDHLLATGHQFLDVAGLRRWLAGEFTPNARCSMITFDDGWGDNRLWAQPALAKRSIRATLAVNTGLMNPADVARGVEAYSIIDSKVALEGAVYGRDKSSFLTWPELREMRDSGVWDVQAHGDSHFGRYRDLREVRGFYPERRHWTMERALGEAPFPGAPRVRFTSELSAPLTELDPDLKRRLRESRDDSERRRLCRLAEDPVREIEGENEFERRVEDDLRRCRETLSEKLGVGASAFFWPWGQSSPKSRSIAKRVGYDLQFTMERGAVWADVRRDRIPRIAAPNSLTKLKRRRWVHGGPLVGLMRRLVG